MGTKKLEDSAVVSNGVVMLILSGLIGGLAVIGGALLIGGRLASEGLPYWSFALAVPLISGYSLVRTLLQGANRIARMNLVRLADAGFRSIAILSLWFASSLTVSLAVAVSLTSLLAATSLGVVLLWWRLLQLAGTGSAEDSRAA